MTWHDILSHADVVEQLRRRFAAGKIYGTFLFVGPAGVGKRTVARRLAQTLLCQAGRRTDFEPCGTCEDCLLMAAGTHPDLLTVEKPTDKSFIPLEAFLGEKEHRMQEGLCHDIALRPFRGGRRVAIIDDADYLNAEGANCLLKTLEEPPPKSVMILIGTSPDRQLPTIRSRSQIVRFRPLATDDAIRLIRDLGLAEDDRAARRLATMSEGSLERARRLADPVYADFRRGLYARLSEQGWHGADVAKQLSTFAEEAGKEAAARRERLRWAIGFLVDLVRQTTRAAEGGPAAEDDDLQQAAERLARQVPADVETLAAVVDRCLDALEHVERNAHPTTLVDALGDDVQKLLSRSTQVVSP